jgi:alpha/beta superfamily hydrolase
MRRFALAGLLLACAGCEPSTVRGSEVRTAIGDLDVVANYNRSDLSEPAPILLLMHDPRGDHDRHDFDRLWDGMHEVGYALLAPDLRGFGQSGGSPSQADDPEGLPRDLQAWLGWIDRRVEEDGELIDSGRVGVIGLGASASLAVAAAGAGVADCAVAVSPSSEQVHGQFPGLSDGVFAPEDVLYMAGEEHTDSAQSVQELSEQTSGANQVRTLPGDLYGHGLFEESALLRAELVEWCIDTI